MAVRIRLKRLGRLHRPFFRVCAMDSRSPRGGKAIEELGIYDPMVKDTDARAVLNGERIDYWLGVGAQPSDKVKVLIKKYGTQGTHLEKQKAALQRLAVNQKPAPRPLAAASATAASATAERPQEEQPASEQPASEQPASEQPASE